MSTPIEPTRVIPAGDPLPAPRTAPWTPPPAPPAPPAWWDAPPPGGPPAALPPQDVHIRVDVHFPEPVPPPVPPRFDWSRLWSWITARHWIGVGAALAPFFSGQSLATGWGTELRECRAEASVGGAWTLAVLVVAVTYTISRWRPRWYSYALATTALFGLAAQASPFDLVTLFTGVTK